MKTNLLYVGALSILLMASSSSFAKTSSSRSRTVDTRFLQGYQRLTPENKARFENIVNEINQRYPDFFSNNPALSVGEVYRKYLAVFRTESSSGDLLSPASLFSVTVPLGRSEAKAQAIVGIIESGLPNTLVAPKKTELTETLFQVIRSGQKPNIASSLEKLAEKITENNESIRSEDVQTIVEFVANTKDLSRTPAEGSTPSNGNIILDIAQHGYDMVSWPASNRSSALDLMSRFNEEKALGKTTDQALSSAFSGRGYETVAKREDRKRVIRDKCR